MHFLSLQLHAAAVDLVNARDQEAEPEAVYMRLLRFHLHRCEALSTCVSVSIRSPSQTQTQTAPQTKAEREREIERARQREVSTGGRRVSVEPTRMTLLSRRVSRRPFSRSCSGRARKRTVCGVGAKFRTSYETAAVSGAYKWRNTVDN
jgi:hypothetical protein